MKTVKGTAAIRQGQADIVAAFKKYERREVSAEFAIEEIIRIAAFYNMPGVRATAKRHLKKFMSI